MAIFCSHDDISDSSEAFETNAMQPEVLRLIAMRLVWARPNLAGVPKGLIEAFACEEL
jgi:hypothetical protein